MFCSNCGKQIPDNTKFCNYCGAQQLIITNTNPAPNPTVNQQNYAYAPAQQPAKAPKKKTGIIIVATAAIVAFLLGKFVIGPSLISDSAVERNTELNTEVQVVQTQQATENNDAYSFESSNPAYDAIFADTYIVHFQIFFNMDTKSFAKKMDNGMICCSDFGYKDDVVMKWVETVYIPISGYSDAEKADLEKNERESFASLDAMNCCTVDYSMGATYFTVTVTYSNADTAEVCDELYQAGIMATNTYISMSATEDSLLNQGFVEK